jgi:hypothetical protein
MYIVPVHKIWYTFSIYRVNSVVACTEAFAEWQESGSAVYKATVAMIIHLDSITLGLLYAEPTAPPNVFSAFDNLPAPLIIAVPPRIGTVNRLSQILASASSSAPML